MLAWVQRVLFRRAGGASSTALAVAAVRAGFDRPHTPDGDPDAQQRLAGGASPEPASPLRDHLLARTIFFDSAVLDALERGVDQIAIVGAGYDDRALRFRSPGVRFFELDHPVMQADKRGRLEAIEADTGTITFVSADFTRDPVAELLAEAGQDASRPTLFICEGLVIYLELGEIVYLLRELAARSVAESELAISLAVHPFGMPSHGAVYVANSARGGGGDEPLRTILPESAHLALLRQAGWDEHQVRDDGELLPDGRSRRSLLVRASPT